MCINCWKDRYGAPEIVTADTRRASDLISRVYEFCYTGGNLHIVLDDWNLKDRSLAFCRGVLDNEAESAKLETESLCLTALEALSVEERASALALSSGFIGGE